MDLQALDFDRQADAFDRRAGLPATAAAAIGVAVVALGPASGPWLEIGVGSGELGWPLARAAFPSPVFGLDRSLAMLRVARGKRLAGATLRLAQADADAPWPLADASVQGVFASRAAHLLDSDHFLRESRRVLLPGGLLVLGAVRRRPDGVRATLQREMRAALDDLGPAPRQRDARRVHERLCELFAARGGRRLPAREVARWATRERPADSLAAWRAKGGLAGRMLPAAELERVLAAVEERARRRYGDLEAFFDGEESYELQAVRSAAASEEGES